MLKRILYSPHISFKMEIDGKTETSGFPLLFTPVLSGRAYGEIDGTYKREDTGLPEFPGISKGTVRDIATDVIEKGIVIVGPSDSGESRNIMIFANDYAVAKGSFVSKGELLKDDLDKFSDKERRVLPSVNFVPYLVFAIEKTDEFAPVYRHVRKGKMESGERELTAMFKRTINTKLMKVPFSGRVERGAEHADNGLYLLTIDTKDSEKLDALDADSFEQKFRSKKKKRKFVIEGELIPLESLVSGNE